MNDKAAYHHEFWIGAGPKNLQVDVAVWAMPSLTPGSDNELYVRTIIQKTIEFYVLPGNA